MTRQYRYLLLLLLAALLSSACQAPQPATPTSSPTAGASPVATATASVEEEAGESQIVFAAYESCTVYAGATDFYFKTEDGKMLNFRNSNSEDEKPTVKLSVELVDRSGNSEGPPGANPQWIGKKFALAMDADGKITAVSPLNSSEDSKNENQTATVDSDPNSPVIFALPEGMTTETFGGHEGTATFIKSSEDSQVHIFVPNTLVHGKLEILGEKGLLASNKWTVLESGRASQPTCDWATQVVPFSAHDGFEGAVWVDESDGQALQVVVTAPADELDDFFQQVAPMLKTLKLR